MPHQDAYIHPESAGIERFIDELQLRDLPQNGVVRELFRWFDRNVSYSRLNAPYVPLQRSDLDVLEMRSGTCGDYTNLVVSVLTRLGFQAEYAFVRVDCYGDPQEHICAVVRNGDRSMLIDATLPYRKWHGPDCPHRECELLSCEDMRIRLKQDEQYWTDMAEEWGNASYAGLLYAPWIHEETVVNTEDVLETVFFMLVPDGARAFRIDVYSLVYTRTEASCPILCSVKGDERLFRFSVHPADNLWDEKQWGEAYPKERIPEPFRSERLMRMLACMERIVPRIQKLTDL